MLLATIPDYDTDNKDDEDIEDNIEKYINNG